MNYFSRVSNPTAIRDLITGITYPFTVGDESSRRSAEVSAQAAQQSVKASLGLPESAGLAEWQTAYAASQE